MNLVYLFVYVSLFKLFPAMLYNFSVEALRM